jgi:hypothetical protein
MRVFLLLLLLGIAPLLFAQSLKKNSDLRVPKFYPAQITFDSVAFHRLMLLIKPSSKSINVYICERF